MIVKVFKNGNVNLKAESDEAFDLESLIATVAQADELDFRGMLEDGAPVAFGNSHAAYAVDLMGYEYFIGPDAVEALTAGRVAKLRRGDAVPLFVMPRYYDFYEVETRDGRKGMVYKLCDGLTADQREAFAAVPGVEVLRTSAQYAPELQRAALFVEYGTPFAYC